MAGLGRMGSKGSLTVLSPFPPDIQEFLSSCWSVNTALSSMPPLWEDLVTTGQTGPAKLSGLRFTMPITNTFLPGLMPPLMCPPMARSVVGGICRLEQESPRSCLNAHHLASPLHCCGHRPRLLAQRKGLATGGQAAGLTAYF